MLDFFRLGLRTSATKSTTRTQPTKKLEKQIKHFKHLLILVENLKLDGFCCISHTWHYIRTWSLFIFVSNHKLHIYSNKLQFRKNIFKKLHVSGPKSQYTSIRVQPDNLSLLAFEIKNHIETNAQNACLSIMSSLELLIMCLLFLNHLLQDILQSTFSCLSTSIRDVLFYNFSLVSFIGLFIVFLLVFEASCSAPPPVSQPA